MRLPQGEQGAVNREVGAQVQNLGAFVWSIAEILRGDFKQSEYGKVILPFVVLRRLDCILEATKDAVLAEEKTLPAGVDERSEERRVGKGCVRTGRSLWSAFAYKK